MFSKEKVVKHRRMRVFCKQQCISDMFVSRVHVFVVYKNALFPSICGLSIFCESEWYYVSQSCSTWDWGIARSWHCQVCYRNSLNIEFGCEAFLYRRVDQQVGENVDMGYVRQILFMRGPNVSDCHYIGKSNGADFINQHGLCWQGKLWRFFFVEFHLRK